MNLLENYRKTLDRNQRILVTTHLDLDGAASSIVLKNIYKNLTIKALKYGEVDNYLLSIDPSQYDLVIFTDISPEADDAFEKLPIKYFLLDHHATAVRFHSPENNRIVIPGKCAASLIKEFFENLFNIDLSYLNDFCKVVNDYDMFTLKDPRSWALNELFFFYYDSDFIKRFRNGDLKFSNDEAKYILSRKKEFDTVYKNLKIYELDRINVCFVVESSFVNDICHKLMHEKGYPVAICVNSKSKTCSVRSKVDNLDVGKMLQELGLGGGHFSAGAFRLVDNDIDVKMNKIEEYIYNNFKEYRV